MYDDPVMEKLLKEGEKLHWSGTVTRKSREADGTPAQDYQYTGQMTADGKEQGRGISVWPDGA